MLLYESTEKLTDLRSDRVLKCCFQFFQFSLWVRWLLAVVVLEVELKGDHLFHLSCLLLLLWVMLTWFLLRALLLLLFLRWLSYRAFFSLSDGAFCHCYVAGFRSSNCAFFLLLLLRFLSLCLTLLLPFLLLLLDLLYLLLAAIFLLNPLRKPCQQLI